MGIKSEIEVRAKAVAPTKDQLRLAQLTMDNGVSDDEEAIKRLIKKVIETTLCSASRAEIALFDNDNDVDAAVLQILENPSEDWVEKGKKKEKKRDEEIRSGRGQSSQRGRLWSDKGAPRGGGARGAGAAAPSTGFSSRGASRGGSQTGRGRGGSTTRPVTGSRSQAQDVPKTVPEASDIPDENKDWKSGPLVFKRSDETESYTVTSSASVSSAVPASQGPPAPFSFAAVAAAGANKEKQRQQQTHPQASHSALAATEEPVPSGSSEITEEDVYEQVDEAPRTPSPVPAAEEEPSPPVEQSPVIQANDHWTNQLKNDLGIGLAPPPAVQFAGNAASPSASLPPQTVEFVSEAAPTVSASATSALPGYQFGFLVEPSVNVDVERPAHTATASSTVNVTTESLFSRSQVASQQQHPVQTHQPQQTSQPSPPQQKPEFQESVRQMSNGDFSQLKTSPPVSIPSYGQPSRGLSYDTSSVSYAPQEPRAQTAQHMPKPPMQQQQPSQQPSSQHASQQQQQPPGSQHSQQMQYPHQMPYGNYPYMNMYSPVAGLRADDPSYAAAALMQYPFGMGQIDLSTILPQNNISQSQPTAQPQHRSDSHGLMDMKGYQSGVSSSRDSSVAPPPGFANPNPFVPQHGLSNLFMQQQYAAHSIPFMMPSVGGRQMYGGAGGADDERKGGYDSGRGTKTGAQATPPPHYPTHGGYLGGLGKPKPQPQPYGHAGWNN